MNRIATSAIALALPLLAFAQGGPLSEDSARLGEALRGRAQKALDAVFGPGRAAVRVEVELGLTSDAKDWVARVLAPPAAPKGPGTAATALKPVPEDDDIFTLPGYPADAPKEGAKGPGEASTPPRPPPSTDLLRTFGTEVVRMSVSVSLDSALPSDADKRAEDLVRETLRLSVGRGDVYASRREAFPAPWQALLSDPALLAGMAGKGLLVLAVSLGAFALWRTGAALRDGMEGATSRIAAAMTRSTQRSLELNLGGSATLGREGPLQFAPGGAILQGGVAPGAPAAPVPEDPFFAIAPGDAPKLHHLLKDQPPEHLAIVLPRLKPPTREALLSLMPRERSAEVLATMVPVRFVDPEVLETVGKELERRVGGVVGGIEYAADMLRSLPSAQRDELLKILREKEPEAAASLRAAVLLLDDLQRLAVPDLELLIRETRVEELAAACHGLPERFVSAVAAALPRRSGALLKEISSLGGPDLLQRSEAAREQLLARAETLIREGRIKRPPALSARLGFESAG